MKKGVAISYGLLGLAAAAFAVCQSIFLGMTKTGRIGETGFLGMSLTLIVSFLAAVICIPLSLKAPGSVKEMPASKPAGSAMLLGSFVLLAGAVFCGVTELMAGNVILGVIWLASLFTLPGLMQISKRISGSDRDVASPLGLIPMVWLMVLCVGSFILDPILSTNQMKTMVQCAAALCMLQMSSFGKLSVGQSYKVRLSSLFGMAAGIFSVMALCYGVMALMQGGEMLKLLPKMIFALGVGIVCVAGAFAQFGEAEVSEGKRFRALEPEKTEE